MTGLYQFLRRAAEFLIPRFMIDEVALEEGEDGVMVIVCSMADVDPDETFAAMCRVRCFSWLGFGLFPKMVGEPRRFVNPHSKKVDA